MRAKTAVHRRFVALLAAVQIASITNIATISNIALAQTNGPGPALCLNLGNSNVPPPTPPKLGEQLKDAGIRPGSPLAALVRANQEFNRLRPEEIADGKPIPLWLRVHWVKAHPRSRYQASDPLGGYPAVLLGLYRWMLHHQDLKAGPAPALEAPVAMVAGVAGVAAAAASGEQRISGAQAAPVSSSDVRINALHPNQILATADDPVGVLGRVQIFYSTDGGASWGRSSLPLGFDEFQSDGAVEWTADGTAWATAVTLTPINEIWAYFQLRAYRSSDQGQTWVFDALLSGNLASSHRERLWVDRGASSPYKDTLYAAWNDLDGVYVNRRTPGPPGDNAWHSAILISDDRTLLSTEGAEAETNGAGEVFAFWGDSVSRRLFVAKSTDGGASFATPVPAARVLGNAHLSMPPVPTGSTSVHASGGAFRSATVNQVYVVWADLSGNAGCTLWTEQPTFVTGGNSCKSRVWFARSDDGGATWSPPVRIHDRPALDDQFAPVLAVDEASGKLALTYYSTAGDPGRTTTNLFYQSSLDGGTTWSDPLQVTTARTDETILGADPSGYGTHNGLSAENGAIVATWTDRRSGGFEEVWSAAIADPAPCASPAATGLVALPRPAGVDLTWDAVPGATYRVLRAPAAGGPYGEIAAPTLNGYFDPAGGCGVTSYYAVQVVNGCVSAPAAEVAVPGRPTSLLYGNDFESGSGVADWRTGAVPDFGTAADWRGIQSCPANSGSRIFRFGGATCTSGAGPGDIAFAYPQGPDGIPIPAGTTGLQLSFWHRRDFDVGSGGFLGLALSDVLDACLPISAPALSGATYSAVIRSACAPLSLFGRSFFTGASDTFTQTIVDLEQAYADDYGIVGSPAGHVVEPLFLAYTDCGVPPQTGWFIDDVQVTACLAPPAPAYGFYTVAPCRLLDTRNPAGPDGGPRLGPAAARDLTLAGRCGVPPTAKAISINVTVVQPAASGSVLLYPDDQTLPVAATISFATHAVRTNNAIVGLGNGTGGAIAQNQSAGGVDLVIDVNGYFQ